MMIFLLKVLAAWVVLSVAFVAFIWPTIIVRMERSMEATERKPPTPLS